ncbi:MAG: biotin--[acetyl-CoA-carboxylase] ligase [Chloroflexi bacterium]|nr:biotin--[acetyl-CoA-carboxylase] ligase [Chloroflexota bacterium]
MRCHQVVDSTQDVAREAVRRGAEGPVLVVTQRQSSGRGRRGRRWVHAPGGLAFTLAVQVPLDAPAAWPTMAAALGSARAVEAHTGIALGIKWPNDLVHGGRKVGGVLAEAHGPWSLVGVGLNVNSSPGVADDTPTACLAEIGGAALDLSALLIELTAAIVGALLADATTRRALQQPWNELSVVLGEWVFVSGPDGHVYGRVDTLPADGSLHLALDDGTRRVITTGDVSLRLDRTG